MVDYPLVPQYPRDKEFILKRPNGAFRGYVTGCWVREDGTLWVFIEAGGVFAVGPHISLIPVKELPPVLYHG